MSGRKQHFIPQSLLRGFGREAKGSKIQVVVYTYDRGIFIAATDGVGAERNFYSELAVAGEAETLDDKITGYETSLADALFSFRGRLDGEVVDRVIAAELVTHLIVRNDHFRKAISSAGTSLLTGVKDTISSDEKAKSFVGLEGNHPSALVDTELSKAWTLYGPLFSSLGLSEAQFKTLIFGKMQVDFPSMLVEMLAPPRAALAALEERIPDVAANAQRSSLELELSPPIRVERLTAFDWRIVHSDAALVLPDCVAIGYGDNLNAIPLVLADPDTLTLILMPVSSHRLLVGARAAAVIPLENLNDMFVACSWDFFVSSGRTPELDEMRELLRRGVSQFVDETVEAAVGDSIREHSSPA